MEFSFQNGKEILKQKELLNEIRTIGEDWKEAKKNLVNWEFEKVVSTCGGTNTPHFDAFKNGVAIEHECREQMNLRSHLLMLEAAYREDKIDMAVVVVPSGNDAKVSRTKRELEKGVFAKYFPLTVPIFLYEP